MWDLLKSKISNFISKIKGEEEKKDEGPQAVEEHESEPEKNIEAERKSESIKEKERELELKKEIESEKELKREKEIEKELEKRDIVQIQGKPESIKEKESKLELKKEIESEKELKREIEKELEKRDIVKIQGKPESIKEEEERELELKKEIESEKELKREKEIEKELEKRDIVQIQGKPESIKEEEKERELELKKEIESEKELKREKEIEKELEKREIVQIQGKEPRKESEKEIERKEIRESAQVQGKPESTKGGIDIKVGIADKLKKVVFGKIKLSREKVEEIADELELSLIQADVHPDVAAEVCAKIKEKMGEREFARGDLENEIKEILREVFEKEAFGENGEFDLIKKVKEGKKPYKILFVGPNGAGKTTTIAKVAKMLMDAGFTVVISASDTFRAAAIEQTEEHGKRLGVKVIRQGYGADAAAVAFDAIKHAEANNIDVVLIDSAGRQDTNFNLLRELQKMNRIANPDAKIFIGESIAGNSLYQQVAKFKEMIGLDGVILTKVDCDAKGGTAISILRETGVPIIYLGMGQAYADLKKFDPKYIIDNLM